jgi:hypothetical protein
LLSKLPGATQGLLLAYGIKDEVISKLIASGGYRVARMHRRRCAPGRTDAD